LITRLKLPKTGIDAREKKKHRPANLAEFEPRALHFVVEMEAHPKALLHAEDAGQPVKGRIRKGPRHRAAAWRVGK